jgi:kynurenine formamidase
MSESFVVGDRRLTMYDLSDSLGADTSSFEPNPHHIDYRTADKTAAMTEEMFGLGAEMWPDGQVWNVEVVTLGTHSGTHVDAPIHYGPARSGHARTITEVPLRWCFGPGVRLDMTHKGAGDGITAADLEAELARIDYQLQPLDIVLVMTGASANFDKPGYEQTHPGLRRSATEFLVDAGVKLIGIDAWGIDRPFDVMAAEAKAGDTGQLWESHILGREKEYCQIEKLSGLDQLPAPFGFVVSALPVKLDGASAGWARVVAWYEEPLD